MEPDLNTLQQELALRTLQYEVLVPHLRSIALQVPVDSQVLLPLLTGKAGSVRRLGRTEQAGAVVVVLELVVEVDRWMIGFDSHYSRNAFLSLLLFLVIPSQSQ